MQVLSYNFFQVVYQKTTILETAKKRRLRTSPVLFVESTDGTSQFVFSLSFCILPLHSGGQLSTQLSPPSSTLNAPLQESPQPPDQSIEKGAMLRNCTYFKYTSAAKQPHGGVEASGNDLSLSVCME